MTSLYVLAAEHRAAVEQLEELNLDEATFNDTLESLGSEIEPKAISTAMVARNLESLAEQIKAAEAEMAKRRKVIENNAERVRRYLLDQLQRAGITKVDSPHFRISVRKGTPAVLIEDEKQLPADYLAQPEPPAPRPDKALIKKAIQDGFEVPGAKLVSNPSLQIR